ncbi:hypothetical protein ACHAQA_009441 [Verticillium albo-atrum]
MKQVRYNQVPAGPLVTNPGEQIGVGTSREETTPVSQPAPVQPVPVQEPAPVLLYSANDLQMIIDEMEASHNAQGDTNKRMINSFGASLATTVSTSAIDHKIAALEKRYVEMTVALEKRHVEMTLALEKRHVEMTLALEKRYVEMTTTLDAKLSEHGRKLTELATKVANTITTHNTLKKVQDGISRDIMGIKAQNQTITEVLDALQIKVGILEAEQTGVKETITKLSSHLASHGEALGAVNAVFQNARFQ